MAMTVEEFAARLIDAITKAEADLIRNESMAVDAARALMRVKFAVIDALHPSADELPAGVEAFNAVTEEMLQSLTRAAHDKLALG